MLKQYFIEKGNEELLALAANLELTDAQKCQCVNIVADYGVSLFGLNPFRNQYQMLAIAAVDLINGLKSKTGAPTVNLSLILFSILLSISEWKP